MFDFFLSFYGTGYERWNLACGLESLLGETRERISSFNHRDDGHRLCTGSHLEGAEERVQDRILGLHVEHVEPGRCFQVKIT